MSVFLFVSYSGAFGGAERLLIDFGSGLEGELCVACPPGQLAESARQNGMRVFPIRARALHLRATRQERLAALARLALHRHELQAIVRNVDPDVVLAWGMRSAIACLLPRVHRGPIVFQHNDFLPSPAVGALVRASAARAERVITLSEASADDLDPARAMRSLRVVHPGIDVERFATDAVAAEPPEVLVLGALVGWKRPELALEACALARHDRPELRLRFVGAPFDGDGDGILATLRERAARPDLAGAVEFAGAVGDPRSELARATCLLHCAPREPFGLAVLEALAASRPVVVPAAAGPAEIADESCGLLYRPDDAEAAGAALARLLADPARAAEMGVRGRARARAHFERTAAVQRYADAVIPLVRRRAAAPSGAAIPALVTVTYNSAPQLGSLLRSVERHLPEARIVVVDCASRDGTVPVAKSWQERLSVDVVELAENVGFGRACNRGLAEVQEPVSVMLNPDVELVDDSLLALAGEALAADQPERLLAPLVLTPAATREDSVHPVPGSPPDLIRALVPGALLPFPFTVPLAPWQARHPRRVGWAVGCALAARTETLRRLGPFDERIFLYGEDLELGLRAASAGVETWFWPDTRVVHHRAHSTFPAFGGEPLERLLRARRDVVTRRLGGRRARLDDLSQLVTFGSRLVAKRALGRPAARERRLLGALARVRHERG